MYWESLGQNMKIVIAPLWPEAASEPSLRDFRLNHQPKASDSWLHVPAIDQSRPAHYAGCAIIPTRNGACHRGWCQDGGGRKGIRFIMHAELRAWLDKWNSSWPRSLFANSEFQRLPSDGAHTTSLALSDLLLRIPCDALYHSLPPASVAKCRSTTSNHTGNSFCICGYIRNLHSEGNRGNHCPSDSS